MHSLSLPLLSAFALSRSFCSVLAFQSLTATSFPPHRVYRMSSGNADQDDDTSIQPKRVVIAGGGVIGSCTAYYLSKKFGISCTIVDPSGEIAPAASGKAGGFLALDWNDMTPLGSLARRSFALHQEIADELGAENIQYRRLTCAAIGVDNRLRRPGGKKLDGVEWVAPEEGGGGGGVVSMRMMGNEETIAQVHPKMLCQNLWKKASDIEGSRLVKGSIVSPVYDDESSGTLVGAKLEDGTVLEADALLFACGPWTANIMTGVKYHSVIIPTDSVLSQCVFFSGCGDPEVYVRPDSTAYCTGFPDAAIKVTEKPGQECVRPEAVKRIVSSVREASGESLGAEPSLEQACYLPTTPDGLPIMGKVPKGSIIGGGDQCYVAAGHSCWGILLGPATGESMAHLIATGSGTEHVNLRPFEPSRYRNMQLLE